MTPKSLLSNKVPSEAGSTGGETTLSMAGSGNQ